MMLVDPRSFQVENATAATVKFKMEALHYPHILVLHSYCFIVSVLLVHAHSKLELHHSFA